MVIAATDPFMAEAPTRRPGDFYRNKQGTPYVSDPGGRLVKKKRKADLDRIATLPYSRPSGFGKIIEDMYSIHKWDQRQEAYGFALAPELVERAGVLIEIEDRDSKEWKDEADKIIKAAKLAAKASISADRGSHTHGLTEDDDEDRDIITRIETGEELGMPPGVQHALVEAWRAMLARDGLEILAVEMPVVNDTYRAAGTLDRVARLTKSLRFALCTGEVVILPAGTVVILDLKTGKRRRRDNGTVMYWHSYAVQVFLYGPTALPYDTETDTRGEWPWEVDGKYALIAHLDVLGALDGKPTCDLILVDLEAGRQAADLCVAAKAWATRDDIFSVAQLDPAGDELADSTTGEPAASLPGGEIDHPTVNDLLPRAGMPQHALDELEADRLNEARRASYADWPRSNSARLVVVDVRADLATAPEQGADLADGFDDLWACMFAEFTALDNDARLWRGALVGDAQRAHVPFHVQEVRTERAYHINKGVIALAAGEGDHDEILRALLALVLGEVAYFPAVKAGHALGSLTAGQAEQFASLVDAFHAGALSSSVDPDGTMRFTAA